MFIRMMGDVGDIRLYKKYDYANQKIAEFRAIKSMGTLSKDSIAGKLLLEAYWYTIANTNSGARKRVHKDFKYLHEDKFKAAGIDFPEYNKEENY